MKTEYSRLMDALDIAWGLIANTRGGNWERESPEWQKAAAEWRDLHYYPRCSIRGRRVWRRKLLARAAWGLLAGLIGLIIGITFGLGLIGWFTLFKMLVLH